tara:strand:+ start:779 stop:1483 length:705 start_codon:yes stop_codon:yes gene_type:complete
LDSQLIVSKETKADLKTTWKIYKSQWKTFLVLTGFIILAYLIYAVLDLIISLIGIAPLTLSEYEYLGGVTILISLIVRTPIYLFYSVVFSLLSVLYMVIPALYFEKKEIITWKVPYKELKRNLKRYLLAGILFSGCLVIGFLFCILPGIVISLIGPAYTNKIACSDMPILKAFTSSFQSVFKSPNLWPYIGMQILAGLIYIIPTVCTCGIGSIVTLPLLSIYSQHLAYNKGILN